ncbi:MAG: methyltransferase domain-containing protein [Acetobacteraceae bacterium]|nr:methyltransferase domain-containing protein [Acetobacteraceae bacterium]
MDWTRRSLEKEWMETERVEAGDYARCLADLAVVNTVTLARRPTLAFMRRVTRGLPPGSRVSVLDAGFGEGDMLRRIARWGKRRGLALELEGVDLDPVSAQAAAALTPPELGIRYRTGDVFDERPRGVDVVISSLFTHHLTDAQVVAFLRWMERTARLGWFVNDLHRHALAYHGFALLSRAAGWHRFVQHDGRLSVARSFRRADWARLLAAAGLERVAEVRWHVPFRLCVSRVR